MARVAEHVIGRQLQTGQVEQLHWQAAGRVKCVARADHHVLVVARARVQRGAHLCSAVSAGRGRRQQHCYSTCLERVRAGVVELAGGLKRGGAQDEGEPAAVTHAQQGGGGSALAAAHVAHVPANITSRAACGGDGGGHVPGVFVAAGGQRHGVYVEVDVEVGEVKVQAVPGDE